MSGTGFLSLLKTAQYGHTIRIPVIGEQYVEHFGIAALDGPVEGSAAVAVLGIWVGPELQELAGDVDHAVAGPGSLAHTRCRHRRKGLGTREQATESHVVHWQHETSYANNTA